VVTSLDGVMCGDVPFMIYDTLHPDKGWFYSRLAKRKRGERKMIR